MNFVVNLSGVFIRIAAGKARFRGRMKIPLFSAEKNANVNNSFSLSRSTESSYQASFLLFKPASITFKPWLKQKEKNSLSRRYYF